MEGVLGGKTLLVCGGAGFIGSNFIRSIFASHTNVRVMNFDKLTYCGNPDNLGELQRDPRYIFIRGDIANSDELTRVFEEYKPNYIVNFAAESHVDRSIHGSRQEFLKTNVEGVFNILEFVKNSPFVEKFVQVSTDEVYGDLPFESSEKFTEESPLKPSSPYASTKAAGDLLCLSYARTFGVPVVVTRCGNNFGPFQYPEKIIPFFFIRLAGGSPLPLYGEGQNVRDWIYVEDHCSALELCLRKGKTGKVYNIGAGGEKKNIEIAQNILAHFGKDSSWITFVKDRPGHDRRYALDSSKIQRELGWKPRHTFEDAFQKTMEWYSAHAVWVENVQKRAGRLNSHIA